MDQESGGYGTVRDGVSISCGYTGVRSQPSSSPHPAGRGGGCGQELQHRRHRLTGVIGRRQSHGQSPEVLGPILWWKCWLMKVSKTSGSKSSADYAGRPFWPDECFRWTEHAGANHRWMSQPGRLRETRFPAESDRQGGEYFAFNPVSLRARYCALQILIAQG